MSKPTCSVTKNEVDDGDEDTTTKRLQLDISRVDIQQAFLKWVGGKRSIMNHVLNCFPVKIDNYYEPFLGGGSVLLAVLSLRKQGLISITGKIYASDFNETLINVYKDIQCNKDELYKHLDKFREDYYNIAELKCTDSGNKSKPKNISEAKISKERYYYWLREKFNNMPESVEKSAIFIVINHTCFRGLYRTGPNGFNVPFGNYKKPEILSKDRLDSVYALIKDVEFIHLDFGEALKPAKRNDFIYLDPPYAPENSKSFVKYNEKGFSLEEHKRLFDTILELDNSKVKLVMSNADVPLVSDTFKKFQSQKIEAKRAINSKKPGSKTNELLIFN